MIGIISDTHEQVEWIQKAVHIFKEKKVEFVIHCGDLISAGMINYFKDLKVIFVLGNNNCNQESYDSMTEKYGFEKITQTKKFKYKDKTFFVCHGDDKDILGHATKNEEYDYILTGHTHEARDLRVNGKRIINPGSLLGHPKTIALLDIEQDNLEFIDLEKPIR